MRAGSAPFHIDRKSYHLLLDAVPVWICAQCGEVDFDETEVDAIQEAIRSLDKRTEKLAVPA
jgi:YgiT-type zinc finger domain-containing protein